MARALGVQRTKADNYFDGTNVLPFNGVGRLILALNNASDIDIRGNSFAGGNVTAAFTTTTSILNAPGVTRLTLVNNALQRGTYAIAGCNGAPSILSCLPGAVITNTIFLGAAQTVPSGFSFAATLADALARGAGVSLSTITAATAGVVVPR